MNLQFGDYRTPFYKTSFPLGMLRTNGTIRDLSRSKKTSHSGRPTLVFAQNVRLLTEIGLATSTLIAEIDYRMAPEDLAWLDNWIKENDVPSSLFVVTDPLSPSAKCLYEKGHPIWSWDKSGLSSAIGLCPPPDAVDTPYPFSVHDAWTQIVASGQEYMVVPVRDDKVGPKLLMARKYVRELRAASMMSDNMDVIGAANASLSTLHALEDLPVPVSYYDREAMNLWGTVPVRNRLESLERIASSLRGDEPHTAGFLAGITNQLKDAYLQMDFDHSGKPAVIMDAIDLAIKSKSPLGIVVKNRASKQALELFLASKGYDGVDVSTQGILILSPRDLEIHSYSGPLLFTFVPRHKNRVFVLYPRSPRIAFLVYPGERPAVVYILRNELTYIDNLAKKERKADVLSRVGGISVARSKAVVSGINIECLKPRRIRGLEEQDATVSEMERYSLINGIIGDELLVPNPAEADAYLPLTEREADIDTDAKALAIHFESGRTLIVKPTSYVTVFKASTQKVSDTPARKLAPGSYVVLVNESITYSLMEAILERVHRHPKMTYVVVYQRIWIEALRRGMSRCGDTPQTLLEKMKAQGSKVSSPLTLRLWQRGITIGPQDPEDIRRIGRIYGEITLVEKADEINSAVYRVRKIHRQLAHRLRYMIKKAGAIMERAEDADQIVDEELGLYLEDFSDAVKMEEVVSVNGPYDVGSNLLNKVFEGDSWMHRTKLR